MWGNQKEDVRDRLERTEKIGLKRCNTIKFGRICQMSRMRPPPHSTFHPTFCTSKFRYSYRFSYIFHFLQNITVFVQFFIKFPLFIAFYRYHFLCWFSRSLWYFLHCLYFFILYVFGVLWRAKKPQNEKQVQKIKENTTKTEKTHRKSGKTQWKVEICTKAVKFWENEKNS